MTRKQAIVFDLDGVLVDSEELSPRTGAKRVGRKTAPVPGGWTLIFVRQRYCSSHL
jgi:phosphoglycolate phosphatase-like HAD superfamily hydrolase